MKRLKMLLLLFLFIPFFVNAETCNPDSVKVESINLVNKTNGVVENSEANIVDNKIKLDLSMSEVNDVAEYKLVIKNKSKEDFILYNNSFNSKTDYIKYTITTKDNSKVIKGNSEKEVLLKLEYKKEVPNDIYNYSKDLTINFTNDKGLISNPDTGIINSVVIIISILLCGVLLYLYVSKKQTKLFILLFLLPLTIKAACVVNIDLESKIQINKQDAKLPMLMKGSSGNRESNYLRTNIKKKDIETITFTNSLSNHTANGIDCFDVSVRENGSVLAWVNDSDNDGLYEMTIGANGKVYASSGEFLFRYLTNVTSINGMQYLDTSRVTTMKGMFIYSLSLTTIDVSHFDTSNVVDMSYMFAGHSSVGDMSLNEIIGIENIDTSKVTTFASMFQNCSNITSMDLSNWNTSSVTDMSFMFSKCTKLSSLNINNFNTSKVTTFTTMFQRCSNITNLNLSNWNTASATDMSYMFYECSKLSSLNLSNFNTSNVKKMNAMFWNCNNLITLDLSNFNTSSVTDMSFMFGIDSDKATTNNSVIDFSFLSNWDVSNVTNIGSMFQNINIKSFEVFTNWDVSNVTDMSYLFNSTDYSIVTSLHGLENWNTSKVTTMNSTFADNVSLTDASAIRNWDTSKVTNMSGMFSKCSELTTLDLRNFDTSKVTDMSKMFQNCSKLETIFADDSFDTSLVTTSTDMFNGSTNLFGVEGTVYDSSHVDKEYAHIDGGASNPGYFSTR